MTTIFTRTAVEFWSGRKPDVDLAYLIDGRKVTWSEVLEQRRERQRLILIRKRDPGPQWRAAYVSVAHYGSWLMGGWQAMLSWIGGDCWIDRDGKPWKEELQSLFPLLLYRDWQEWKKAFAMQYERRRQLRQPVGVAFLWVRGHELSLIPRSSKEDAA